jgi:outer membrane receptor protein involved in Fe transport
MIGSPSRRHASVVVSALLVGAVLSPPPAARADDAPPLVAPKLSIDPAETQDFTDLTQLSLEQLMDIQVTTLSRVSERIDLAPGSIYAFDHDIITKRGYRSLGELLQTVPGFTVFHKDLDFVAGVRGLNANDNEKISLLINGQNVNGVNEPDFLNGPINLDNARRVEVVVGPSSLFQQANTLAATINVLTRDVEGVVVDAGVGNYLRYSTTVMAGHSFGPDRNFTLSVTTENKRGWDALDPDYRPGLAGRHQFGELDQPNYFVVAKGQYDQLFAQILAYRTTLPELNINQALVTPRNEGQLIDEWYTGYLRLDHPLSADLMAVISGDVAYKRQSRTNEHGHPIDGLQQYLSQVTFDTDWSLQYTGIDDNLLQGGIQGSYDDNLSAWYTLDPGASGGLTIPKTTFFTEDTYAVGAYLEDEYQLTPQIRLNGGARIDRNTRLEPDRWYPGFRAAVILEPTPTWTSKVVYNRAVRFPSPIAALNRAWGTGAPGAPSWAALAPNATQPEILSTIEWQNILYLEKNRLALTLYHQELTGFISWYGPHTNVGNFRGNGVELSIDCPITSNLSLWANASYNNSRLRPYSQYAALADADKPAGGLILPTDVNGRIIGAPQVTANLGFEYEFLKNVTIAPTLRYFTEQTAYDNDTASVIAIRNRFYLDANLTWKNAFDRDVDLHFGIQNLLNNRSPVGGQWFRDTYSPRGISFVFSLEARF